MWHSDRRVLYLFLCAGEVVEELVHGDEPVVDDVGQSVYRVDPCVAIDDLCEVVFGGSIAGIIDISVSPLWPVTRTQCPPL